MPELLIPVGEYIGPSYMDWESFEYVIGFTADDVRMRIEWEAYQGRTVDSVLLQIGICYGGSVRHAMDIYTQLQGLGVPVKAHITSLCASAGTIVALAAEEVVMEHPAQWMTHRPKFLGGVSSERSEDLRADADRLDRDEQAIRDIYAARTGQAEAAIVALMQTDRFLSAQEALDFGFATRVNPLRAKAKPASAAEASARASRFKLAVARADRRARAAGRPVPTARAAAHPKPSKPNSVMTKVTRPIQQATARKPVPTPQATGNAALVLNLAKSLGVAVTINTAEDDSSNEVQSTETDQNGALLYHEGELAQGVAVFYDEALTEAAEDGTYGLADGRSITVAGGVVETITEAADDTENAGTADTSNAAILKRLEALEAKDAESQNTINGLNAELAKFKQATPPLPGATAQRPKPAATDPKASTAKRPHPMDKSRT